MVRLKEIRKTDEDIEACYYPESTEAEGYIRLDFNGNVIEKRLTEYEGYFHSYFNPARNRLEEYLQLEESQIPDQTIVMWY